MRGRLSPGYEERMKRHCKNCPRPGKRMFKKKARVFSRDGWKCRQCGSDKDLTLDHVRPRSKGGDHSWANLETLCDKCNQKKGSLVPIRLLDEFESYVLEVWR